MSRLRLRARWRDRVELHELPGPDVLVGSDPGCDLVLDHRTVSPTHARVLFRRGRLIVADLGRAPTGVTRGGDRLAAPVTLNPGQEVGLGEIGLSGFVDDGAIASLSTLPEGPTGPEIDGVDPDVRRWRTRAEGRPGEVIALEPRLDAGAWLARAARVGSIAQTPSGWTMFQALAPGARLSRLLAAVAEGRIALPPEALLVLAVGLLRAVADLHQRFGPHGLIDPRRVQLGLDGAVQVVLPGPIDDFRDPETEPYLAPERRYGLPPTVAGDVHGAAALALGLVGDLDLPAIHAALAPMLRPEPELRPTELSPIADALLGAAHERGLDPTAQHLGRVIRVVEPEPDARFSHSAPRQEGLPKRDPTG